MPRRSARRWRAGRSRVSIRCCGRAPVRSHRALVLRDAIHLVRGDPAAGTLLAAGPSGRAPAPRLRQAPLHPTRSSQPSGFASTPARSSRPAELLEAAADVPEGAPAAQVPDLFADPQGDVHGRRLVEARPRPVRDERTRSLWPASCAAPLVQGLRGPRNAPAAAKGAATGEECKGSTPDSIRLSRQPSAVRAEERCPSAPGSVRLSPPQTPPGSAPSAPASPASPADASVAPGTAAPPARRAPPAPR